MFYCENCREKNNWPTNVAVAYGECEICGELAECHNGPSRSVLTSLSREIAQQRMSVEEIAQKVYLFAKGTSFNDKDEERIRHNQEYMIPREPGEASMDISDLKGYIGKNFGRNCVDAVMDCFEMGSRGAFSISVKDVGVYIRLKLSVIETLKKNNLYTLE